jgi:hypothetical protein
MIHRNGIYTEERVTKRTNGPRVLRWQLVVQTDQAVRELELPSASEIWASRSESKTAKHTTQFDGRSSQAHSVCVTLLDVGERGTEGSGGTLEIPLAFQNCGRQEGRDE